jgi:hypothetical protein
VSGFDLSPHSYDDEDEFDRDPEYPDRDDAQVNMGTNRWGTEVVYHAHHGRDKVGTYPDEARARAALWDHENSGGSKGYFPNHWVNGELDKSNDRAEYEKDPHGWLSKNSESYAKETENDAGDMVDDAMEGSEHLKGLLTDNKIGPTKYSSKGHVWTDLIKGNPGSGKVCQNCGVDKPEAGGFVPSCDVVNDKTSVLAGPQTCVHCNEPIEEGMVGGTWVDKKRMTGDYRTNHLHEPEHGYFDAIDNIERAFRDVTPSATHALDGNTIGPSKFSSKTAAVPNHQRDKDDMSGHCAEGNHDDCEDYADTTCLCSCHDHHGVPAKYKTGWEDDQYWPTKASKTAVNDAEMSQYSSEIANGRAAMGRHCEFCGGESNSGLGNGEVLKHTEWGAMHPSCEHEWREGVGHEYDHDIDAWKDEADNARHDDRDDDYYGDPDPAMSSGDPYGRHEDAMERRRTYLLRQIEAGVSPIDPAFGKVAEFDVQIPGSTQPMPSPDQATTKPRQMPGGAPTEGTPFSQNDPNEAESFDTGDDLESGGSGIGSNGVGQDQEKFASMVGYVLGSNPGMTKEEARSIAAEAIRVQTSRKAR